jgi:hypothetical protein
MAVNLNFLHPEPLLFHSSSSSVILTRLSGLCSRPTTTQEDLVAPGIEPEISGSVARISDHKTTEVVVTSNILVKYYKFMRSFYNSQ